MTKICLYQFAPDIGTESGSPFCVKVQRALRFKGLTYDVRNVGSPSELKRLNPGVSKLPVLDYDGEVIPESSKILRFLDEKHPNPPLWPTDPQRRAQAQLLEDWADESLYWFAVYHRWQLDSNFLPFSQRLFGKMPIPIRWIVPKIVRNQVIKQLHGQGVGRLDPRQVIEQFSGHVQMLSDLIEPDGFLIGDTLTAADIAVFGPMFTMYQETFPETSQCIAKYPVIVGWIDRVAAQTSVS